MGKITNAKSKIKISTLIPYIVLVLLVLVLAIVKPTTISTYYLGLKCDIALPLIFISIGQTLVVINKGMDLSVGGVMSVSTCILATLSEKNFLLAVLLCLFVGCVTGIVNGLLIAKLKIQPFVVTLGTWTVLDGVAIGILKTDGGVIAKELTHFFDTKIGVFPMSLILILAFIILWAFLRNTSVIYSIYAVGSNENAAYCNGVNITKIRLITYITSGVCASLAGIVYASMMDTGSPTVGTTNIMMSVAATVIGGTSLAGGKGGVYGSIAGVFILKLISDLLVFLGVTSYWTSLFQGLLMIVSVALGSISVVMKQKGGVEYDG